MVTAAAPTESQSARCGVITPDRLPGAPARSLASVMSAYRSA
jgi:hypothetical protein